MAKYVVYTSRGAESKVVSAFEVAVEVPNKAAGISPEELEHRRVAVFPVNNRFDEADQERRARQYAQYMNEMVVVHPSISESVKKMFAEDE